MSFLEWRVAEQSTILQSIQQAIASLDQRMQQGFAVSDQRSRDIDTKMSSQFHWLVGLFVGTFLTTIIGFIGIVMTLLER